METFEARAGGHVQLDTLYDNYICKESAKTFLEKVMKEKTQN